MERDIVVRKVTQDVVVYVWHKLGVIDEEPRAKLSFVPEVTAELMNNLCISVWIDSYCNEFVWEEYLKKHFKRMTVSPYRFANYVAYAFYVSNKGITDAYESFVVTLSIVIHFVLYCWQRERKEFLGTCVDLFCEFFERQIRTNFEDYGGWKYFNEYLVENNESLELCKELMDANEPVYHLFNELENEYRETTEPHAFGDVILEDVTKHQVENNVEAVNFAESVVSKMRELCKQTLTEVIADFSNTDSKVEEMYHKKVGKTSDGITNSAEQSSLPKYQEDIDVKGSELKQSSSPKDQEALRDKENNAEQSSSQEVHEGAFANHPYKTSSKKIEDQQDLLEPLYLESLKSKDFGPAPQESVPNPKLTKKERAKILLEAVVNDLKKLTNLIGSLR